jgi:hypothetical protein
MRGAKQTDITRSQALQSVDEYWGGERLAF